MIPNYKNRLLMQNEGFSYFFFLGESQNEYGKFTIIFAMRAVDSEQKI